MQHRGEIIKQAVYKSGFPITELAKRLGKSRRWVYLLFENPKVSIDLLLKIGGIIHHDFSDDIVQINRNSYLYEGDMIEEKTDGSYWKNKYLNLLEEHIELLKKI